MNAHEMQYYDEMLKRNRLIRITVNGKMIGMITYFIGSLSDTYVRDDAWSVIDDNPEDGTVCYIDQLITNKDKNNVTYSRAVWKYLVEKIRWYYPKVRMIRWNRVKEGKVHVYYKIIRQRQLQSVTV